MTSLSDVAELVRVGNDDTDESNKTLKSIDAKFDKFFKLAERSRLDDLEARLDKSRALKPSNVKSRGVLGTIGAGAGAISDLVKALMNPMNWLKAIGFAALAPGTIVLKGLYNKIIVFLIIFIEICIFLLIYFIIIFFYNILAVFN